MFTRSLRLFAYGALSVVLVFYLTRLGFSTSQVGVLLTLTLVGDTVVSLVLTTRADRLGRRRVLIAGAVLMAVDTVRHRRTDGLLVFMWYALPLAIMSLGSSKLYHYEYPYLPPVALDHADLMPWIRLLHEHREIQPTRPASDAGDPHHSNLGGRFATNASYASRQSG